MVYRTIKDVKQKEVSGWESLRGYGLFYLESEKEVMSLAKRLKALLVVLILLLSLCSSASYANDLNKKELNVVVDVAIEAHKTKVAFEAKEEYRSKEIKELRRKVFYHEVGYTLIIIAMLI